jgi:cytochrome c biogenesis protein CcmG, thiol:disulfide interchange protein DsbE
MKMNRRISIIIFAVFVLALCPGPGCRPGGPSPPAPGGPIGFGFEDGKRATVTDYTGKVLLLNFYATWCGPCRQEMPHLLALHEKYESQGLQIVGLNVGGEEDYEEVPAFRQEFRIPFPLAIPDAEFVERYLGVNQNIPQSFVIDRNGRIVRHFIGFSEDSATEVEAVVLAALKK